MSKLSGQTSGGSKRFLRRFHLKFLSGPVLLALLLALGAARAGEPDDDYLKLYGQIQEAQSLESKGQTSQALTKYREALIRLKAFQKSNPDWNPKVINTRANWLAAQISALSTQPPPAPARTNASTDATADSGSQNGAAAAAPAGQPKLLQAGAEPRKAIRLHPKAGDHQALDMTMKIDTATKMGQMEVPAMKLPTLKLTLDFTVKSVSPDGDITYDMVISDATVADEPAAMPQMVQLIKAALTKAKGMSGTGTVTERGISKSVEFQPASGADPQSRQVLDQMKEVFSGLIVPLPAEAVGPGAKWEVRTANKEQGIQVDQTQTYEVISAEGERLKTRTTGTERAGKQKIQGLPGMAGSIDLTRLTGDSTGEVTYDLGHLVPLEGSAEQHRETLMNMGAGAQKQAVTQKMNLSVQLQARETPATPAGTGAPQKQ